MSAPQPGTPLPWRHNSQDFICATSALGAVVIADVIKTTGRPISEKDENTAYIVHACNNYPKARALADALEMAAGDLHMLTKAVEAGDPRNEILFRISDTKADIEKALAAWDAKP